MLPLLVLTLMESACGTASPTITPVSEDPRGAVFLQTVSERSFLADHPIALTSTLMARVLNGVMIREQTRALQTIVAGPPTSVPVFSADEIEFLAPRLSKALAAAAPNQVIGFRLTRQETASFVLESSATETTAGSLFAHAATLNMSLTQYRSVPTRVSSGHSPSRNLQDKSGLSDRILFFVPASAQRPELHPAPTHGSPTRRSLAIDYAVLSQTPSGSVAQSPMPNAEDSAPPSHDPPVSPKSDTRPRATDAPSQHDAELRALKDLVIKRDLELEALRQELRTLKQQLERQPAVQDDLKPKGRPPSKKGRSN